MGGDKSDDGNIRRTAIVFVHGQGDQVPFEGARDLAFSVLETDPSFELSVSGKDLLWGVPDEDGDDFDLRRLTSAVLTCKHDKSGVRHRFDFLEFYWANEIVSTPFSAFRAWFEKLLQRDPYRAPARLLPVRQIVIRAFEGVFIFSFIGILYALALSGAVAIEWALFAAPSLFGFCVGYDRARTRQHREKEPESLTWPPTGTPGRLFPSIPLLNVLSLTLLPFLTVLLIMFAVTYLAISGDKVDYWRVALWALAALSFAFFVIRQLTLAAALALIGLSYSLISILAGQIKPDMSVDINAIDVVLAVAGGIISTLIAWRVARSESGYALSWLCILLTIGFLIIAAKELASWMPQAWIAEERDRYQAFPAAWAIAGVIIMTVAARFNSGGSRHRLSKPLSRMHRRKHLLQALYAAVITVIPVALIFFGWERNEYIVCAGVIAVIYASIWLASWTWSDKLSTTDPGIYASPRTDTGNATPFRPKLLILAIELVAFAVWAFFLWAVLQGASAAVEISVGVSALEWLGVFFLALLPTGFVLAIIAQRSFFAPVMGDSAVYFSAIPRNIVARRRIRKRGVDLLERLHGQNYNRIIVVAHSLGSVVAYDVLSEFWAKRCKTDLRQKPAEEGASGTTQPVERLRKVREEAGLLESAADNLSAAGSHGEDVSQHVQNVYDQLARFRKAQSEFQLAFSRLPPAGSTGNEGKSAWLVTDFVTVGSPLTYARLLLADSLEAFDKRRRLREFPQCPPIESDADGAGGNGAPYTHWAKKEDGEFGLFINHGAIFAATRWTNIYFDTPGLISGDLIGGPVDDRLGIGIENVKIDNWWNEFGQRDHNDQKFESIAFAHNQYWVWPFPENARKPVWALPEETLSRPTSQAFRHIQELRNALDLAGKNLPDHFWHEP